MLRRTRLAPIVRPYRSADMRGVRFARYHCATARPATVTLWNVPEPELKKASAMPFSLMVEEAIILRRSHFGGTAAYAPASTPFSLRQDEHEVYLLL